MITLKNRKVYVGAPLIEEIDRVARNEPGWIRIKPFASGYRDKDTHEVDLITDYFKVYLKIKDSELKRAEFTLVIAVEDISTVRPFDPEVYLLFRE